MRIHSLLLLGPAALLAAAQEQKPLGEQLQGWLDKARAYLPQAAVAPADAGAAAVAAHAVTELTTDNWDRVLAPRYHDKTGTTGGDTWMVLVTGGNRTCQGRCEHMEGEFNKTAALFAADAGAPSLGLIDCDRSGVLCSAWFTGPPVLWHIQVPQIVNGERPETPIHIFHLNLTTTTAQTFASIHQQKKYLSRPQITGMFHPFDGQFAKLGIQQYVGYAIYAFSKIPSWSIMIAVSFLSRSFVGGRTDPTIRRRAPAAPAGGAPAAG